jgi:hypothetical protein
VNTDVINRSGRMKRRIVGDLVIVSGVCLFLYVKGSCFFMFDFQVESFGFIVSLIALECFMFIAVM